MQICVCRFMDHHGWRVSEIAMQEVVEENNPDEEMYATYAMLHTHHSE